MVQNVSQISPQLVFWLLSVVYFVAYALPSFEMPLVIKENFEDRIPELAKMDQLFYGYQCTLAAFIYMFRNPIPFLGSFANIAVFTMFILQFLRLPGKLTLIKSALVVICIVSTLIWAVALRIGLKEGYYVWTFACIGMSFAFTAQKPFVEDFDDILLDEHTIEKDID